jgi:hypothetical protein
VQLGLEIPKQNNVSANEAGSPPQTMRSP